MKRFSSFLRLRKRRNQNPNNDPLLRESTTDDSAGDRKRETEMEEEEEEPNETKKETETQEEKPTRSTSPAVAERKRCVDGPPTDDCCPICFGCFVVPCRAPCGHWFCGGCILQYWNHCAALKPCNCPLCSRQITRLTPEASLYHQQEVEVTQALEKVQQYNRLFVGGTYGLLVKVLELPLFIKRVFRGMMDPDRPGAHLYALRMFAIFLGFLYTISPFDFIPTGNLSIIDLFDYSSVALSFILYLAGLYLRWRRLQAVRQLAAIQP